MKKIIIIIISLLIVVSLIIGIFTHKKEDNKIVVSEVTHSVFYAPWYVAIRNNYFKEENLNVEVMLTPGADKVASSVLSGDANIGFKYRTSTPRSLR